MLNSSASQKAIDIYSNLTRNIKYLLKLSLHVERMCIWNAHFIRYVFPPIQPSISQLVNYSIKKSIHDPWTALPRHQSNVGWLFVQSPIHLSGKYVLQRGSIAPHRMRGSVVEGLPIGSSPRGRPPSLPPSCWFNYSEFTVEYSSFIHSLVATWGCFSTLQTDCAGRLRVIAQTSLFSLRGNWQRRCLSQDENMIIQQFLLEIIYTCLHVTLTGCKK